MNLNNCIYQDFQLFIFTRLINLCIPQKSEKHKSYELIYQRAKVCKNNGYKVGDMKREDFSNKVPIQQLYLQSVVCIISPVIALTKSIIWSNLFTGNVNEMYFLIEIFLTESFVAEYICSYWLCNLGEMYNKIKYIKFFSSKKFKFRFLCVLLKGSIFIKSSTLRVLSSLLLCNSVSWESFWWHHHDMIYGSLLSLKTASSW